MSRRRHAVFKSSAFNTTEPKDYFINECCFGDDLGRWFVGKLRAKGLSTEDEPGQEDFGWYLTFHHGDLDYDLVMAYRPGDENEDGDWLCSLERRAGFLASLFGARKRGIEDEALKAIHQTLVTAPEVKELRWFDDQDLDSDGPGAATPTPSNE